MGGKVSQPAPNLGLETGSKGRPGPMCTVASTTLLLAENPAEPPRREAQVCTQSPKGLKNSLLSLSLTGCLCFDLLLQTVPVKIKGHLHIKGRISNQSPLWNQGRALGGNRKETLRLDLQAICAEELGQQTPRRTRCRPAGTSPDCGS